MDIILLLKTKLTDNDRSKIVEFGQAQNILRLSQQIDDGDFEKLYESESPKMSFADSQIELPIGAFLQATKQAQLAITNIIVENSADSKNIADLYCGCGTYSFPLAKLGKRVVGYEGTSDMVMAMFNAIEQDNIFT